MIATDYALNVVRYYFLLLIARHSFISFLPSPKKSPQLSFSPPPTPPHPDRPANVIRVISAVVEYPVFRGFIPFRSVRGREVAALLRCQDRFLVGERDVLEFLSFFFFWFFRVVVVLLIVDPIVVPAEELADVPVVHVNIHVLIACEVGDPLIFGDKLNFLLTPPLHAGQFHGPGSAPLLHVLALLADAALLIVAIDAIAAWDFHVPVD